MIADCSADRGAESFVSQGTDYVIQKDLCDDHT